MIGNETYMLVHLKSQIPIWDAPSGHAGVGLQIGNVYIDTPERSDDHVTSYKLDGHSRQWFWPTGDATLKNPNNIFVIYRNSTGRFAIYTGKGDRENAENWIALGPFKCSILQDYQTE